MPRSQLVGGLVLCTLMALAPALGQDRSEGTRKVTNRVVPSYPELGHTMNLKGIVKLEASVGPNGTVNSIKVVGGHPVLVQAAERAVQKWRWEPASHESQELIELRFNPQ
jgi:TonB family protein